MDLESKSIAVGAHSERRGFIIALVRRLRSDFNATIHLYCATEQERHYYISRHGELFTSIEVHSVDVAARKNVVLSEADEIARAMKNEERIGVGISSLSVSNRHVGRGFALAGAHHPRSRLSELTDRAKLLYIYNEEIDFWLSQIERKEIGLLINTSKVSAVVGRSRSIPYRDICSSRYKGFFNWAWDEYQGNPQFRLAFDRITEGGDQEIEDPYEEHLENRAQFLKEMGAGTLIRNFILTTLRYIWWTYRGYDKAKGYYLSESLKYIVRRWWDYKVLSKVRTKSIEALKVQKFAYFPLHTEPEKSLQIISPEFIFQHATIAALARDMPADTLLVVKETLAAVGRRPTGFYRQIQDLKNVVFAKTSELGLAYVHSAAVTATICGTAGFEAVVAGRPVVLFGLHNNFDWLGHVEVVRSLHDVSGALRKALAFWQDPRAIERARQDGKRLLAAIEAVSFDLSGLSQLDESQMSGPTMDRVLEHLVAGLKVEASLKSSESTVQST